MPQFFQKLSTPPTGNHDNQSAHRRSRVSIAGAFVLFALIVSAACAGVNDSGSQEDALLTREARQNAPPPTSGSPETPGSPGIDPGNLAATGQQLYTTLGCVGCHTLDGSDAVGPSWQGIIGRETPLDDGSTVTADEAYITESIREPGAQIHEGYQNIMPSFAQLSDDDIKAIIAFMETLQ